MNSRVVAGTIALVASVSAQFPDGYSCSVGNSNYYGWDNDDDDPALCSSNCCVNGICKSSVNCEYWWIGIIVGVIICLGCAGAIFWFFVQGQRGHHRRPVVANPQYTGPQNNLGAPLVAPPMYPNVNPNIDYQCPQCGVVLAFPASSVGSTVQCGVCKHVFPLLQN